MRRTSLLLLFCAACDSTPPPVKCEGSAATAPAFVDATADWGLAPVTGNRIVSGDLDGDGYPDLIIHAISSNKRETIGAPPKLVWVLMNRPRPSGAGRMFVDATVDSGLFALAGSTTELRAAHLAVLADVDNDGDLDVFSGTYVDATKPMTDPGDRSVIMLNDGSGHFTPAAGSDVSPPPLPDGQWPTTSATFVDADRDGKIDLFVGFWYELYGQTDNGLQAQLYRGSGDGTFQYNTQGANLLTNWDGFADGTNHRPAYGVTSCDLDGDGAPELMVTAYGRQWNLLYKNRGDGAFDEIGQASGFAGDDDREYKDNQFFLCACTAGLNDPKCAGAPQPQTQCPTPAGSAWRKGVDDQPWRLNGNGFTTYCGDLDGDGRFDLYTAGIHHWWAGQSGDSSELLHGVAGDGVSFTRPGNATSGMVWPHRTLDWNEGALMVGGGDFDNDGLEDVYVAASDYPDQFGLLFHQKPDHTFEEIGAAAGLHHACASGVTIADFDRDGDLDVIVGSGTARDCSKTWKANEVHLYENQGGGAAFVGLRLVGDGAGSNKMAIGARVTVDSDRVHVTKEVSGGYGHFGQEHDAGMLWFGVDSCAKVQTITVRWPDAAGTTQTWSNLDTRRFYELRQGDPSAHALKF